MKCSENFQDVLTYISKSLIAMPKHHEQNSGYFGGNSFRIGQISDSLKDFVTITGRIVGKEHYKISRLKHNGTVCNEDTCVLEVGQDNSPSVSKI